MMATDIAKRKGNTGDTDAAALHAFIAKVRAVWLQRFLV